MEITKDYEISELIEKAIERYENKKKRRFKERIFRNTKLLMENYNDFKKHINYSVSDINDLQNIIDLDLKENQCDELFILSIKQSKIKTLIITSHIEKSMELLEIEQKREGTIEKYKALEMYYLKKKSYEKIAEELDTGINTPKRWIKQMLERLGILLFGIDGLNSEW